MLRKKDASKSKGADEKGSTSPAGSKKLAQIRKDSKSPKMGSKSDMKRITDSDSVGMDDEMEQTKVVYGATSSSPAQPSHYDSSDSSSSSEEKLPKTRAGIFTVKTAVGAPSPSAARKNSRPTSPPVRPKDKKNYNAFSDSVEMASGEQETFEDDHVVLPESDVDPSPLSADHGAGAGTDYRGDFDTEMDDFDPFHPPQADEKVSSPKVTSKGLFARKTPAKPKEGGKDEYDLPRKRAEYKEEEYKEEELKTPKAALKAEEARKKDKKKAEKAEKAEKKDKKDKKDKKSKGSLTNIFAHSSKKEQPGWKGEAEKDTKPRSGSKGSLKGSKNDISDHGSPEPPVVATIMDSLSDTSSGDSERGSGAQERKMDVHSQPRSGSALMATKKAQFQAKHTRKGMEPGVDDSQDTSSFTSASDRSTWTTNTGLPELTFETFTRYFSQGNNRIDNENRARMMGFSQGVRIAPGANVRVEDPDDIGDDVHIGLFTYINGTVTIEDDVTIGPHCSITSNTHLFNPTQQNWKGNNRNDPIHIKRGCWIAANVTITGGITIGECSLVCAGAVVTHDVPDYSIAAGVPARIVGSIDPTTGHKNWHR